MNYENRFRGDDLKRSMVDTFDGSSVVTHWSCIIQIKQTMGRLRFSRNRFITTRLSQQAPAQRIVTMLQQEIPVPVRMIVQQNAEALRHGILAVCLRFKGGSIPVGHHIGVEVNGFQLQPQTAFVEHRLSRAGTDARDADFPTLQ